MKNTLIIFLSLFFLCQSIKAQSSKDIDIITFGSCNNESKPQILWYFIAQNNPDLWIGMGDNIYADSKEMNVLKRKYFMLKSSNGYKKLRESCEAIGTWDDHDYGRNDGNKTYSGKEVSKKAMLDFFDVPMNAPVRKRAGVYNVYTYGSSGKKVKVILLDERWFKDELRPDPDGESAYFPNMKGDILGEVQWQWLEKELMNSDAQLNLIVSGIQVIPQEHPYEKWADFPNARIRLLKLLQKTQAKNTLILSGDRHMAEISKIKIPSFPNPIYEITSSGMTHVRKFVDGEPNQYRDGEMIVKRNFGVLRIDWSNDALIKVVVEIRGLKNELFRQLKLEYPRN